MSAEYDAIIVGGGHNGLVCGSYLAKTGLRACVLESKSQLGGAVVTESPWPGYRVSTASYLMALLQPKVILDLDLKRHGLEVIPLTPTYQPLEDGYSFTFWSESHRLIEEIRKLSPDDAKNYLAYNDHMRVLGQAIGKLLWETPPDPAARSLKGLAALAAFGLRNLWIRKQFYEVYELLTLSAYDFLGQWFKSDKVKAVLGFYAAAAGGNCSMKSPGSAYILLRGYLRDNTTSAGGSGIIRGGMGSITQAIAAAGREAGLETRTDAQVEEILVEEGTARGVRLRGGEVLRARVVVSNAPAKTTFLSLLKQDALPREFVDDIKAIRDRSTAFKVHLALSGLPSFTGFDSSTHGFDYPALVKIGPSIDYIERAYDSSKYGEFAEWPCLAVLTPSALDATLAPPGHHVMSIFGSHAPYELKTGAWTAADRERLLERTLCTLERFAPNIRSLVVHSQILVAPDYEALFGLPGGHVHHGELSTDQIFFKRPAKHYSDYRSPVRNLFMCGASCHPGGGVTGVPGHNAARVVATQLGKSIR